MKTTRREVIKLGISAAVNNARILGAGVGGVAVLAGCGGGSNSSSTTTTSSIVPPSNLSYQSPAQGIVGTVFGPLSPAVTGSVSSYSVSPAFPAGIALASSTGVISGTPKAAAAAATYTITATNAGGSTTFALQLTIKGAIVISSSTATPTALTPVQLSVIGLDFTTAFNIQITNGPLGYSGVLTPVRIDPTHGIVVVAAPLYIVPSTGKTASLAVSINITQGSLTSNAISWTISDIPSVASYGVNPGDISRGFFNAQAIYFGMTVNALEAMRALPTKTNTTTLQADVVAQQKSTIEARANVDLIVSGSQTSLGVGTAPDGTALSYDANSVDTQDRILGMYLQAIGYLPSTIYATTAALRPPLYKAHRRHQHVTIGGGAVCWQDYWEHQTDNWTKHSESRSRTL